MVGTCPKTFAMRMATDPLQCARLRPIPTEDSSHLAFQWPESLQQSGFSHLDNGRTKPYLTRGSGQAYRVIGVVGRLES